MKSAFTTTSIFVALAASALTFACTQSAGEPVTSDDKIVGGKEATPGAWPGTVALYGYGMQICGGALIASDWVLTAAHCVEPSSPTGRIDKVVIDRHDLTTTVGESIAVKRAFRHARYNSSRMDNDLALLQLVSKSTGPTAKIIGSAQIEQVADGKDVTVVGWGNTSESGRPSNVLREVTVPIISTAECQAFPQYDIVGQNQLCAGLPTGGKDSCQGDSGGPVYFKIGNDAYHVGLTSWGIGCARPNAPGVYTRTSRYLGWIWEKTEGAAGEQPPPSDGGTDAGTFTPFEASGSVNKGELKAFSYDAPPGDYHVTLSGTNDADLYVKVDGAASQSSYDCKSESATSDEECTVTLEAPGKIQVGVLGYSTTAADFALRGERVTE